MKPDAATRQSFWETQTGKEVEKRFDAWCQFMLHGGVMAPTGQGNAVQGKPGDQSAGWCFAMDVEITLKEWGGGKIEAILLHVYGAKARPSTVDHYALDFWIERFFPEEKGEHYHVFDRAKGKIVGMLLLEFGKFMAKQRGL